MATKAKPGAGKGRGAGKTIKEQINGIHPEKRAEFFDKLHQEHDEAEEAAATHRGAINRIYEKGCDTMDVSKDALTFLFKEERAQRKKAAKAAKMDTRARDSLERLAASMPEESPMAKWAAGMAKLAGTATEGAES